MQSQEKVENPRPCSEPPDWGRQAFSVRTEKKTTEPHIISPSYMAQEIRHGCKTNRSMSRRVPRVSISWRQAFSTQQELRCTFKRILEGRAQIRNFDIRAVVRRHCGFRQTSCCPTSPTESLAWTLCSSDA